MQQPTDNFKTVLEALYEHPLTLEEVSECQRNLMGFFETLIKIDREQRQGGDDADNGRTD